MYFIRPLLLAGFVVLSASAPAVAQERAQFAPGARLRVTTVTPPRSEIGRFETLTDTTLVVSLRGSRQSYPFPNISSVELSKGRRPNLVAGIAGLVAGAAIGAAVACAANRDSYGVYCGGQNDTKVFIGAGIGGAAGAAIVSFLFRRDSWELVDLRFKSP